MIRFALVEASSGHEGSAAQATDPSREQEDAMKHWPCALALLALGCGGSQAPATNVKGQEVDIVMFAGTWTGTYEGVESGRKGTIHFELVQGYGVTEGKVIMNAGDPTKAVPLAVKFVDLGQGQVKGKLVPYTDPQCNCEVETEFIGKRQGHTVSGTFTTTIVGTTKVQRGTWRAERVKK
jgi:hypothetical protein